MQMRCQWRLCNSAGSTIWTGCRSCQNWLGRRPKLRMAGDKPYVTDNSNYIVDLYFQQPIKDAKAAADAISKLTGGTDSDPFLHTIPWA